MTAHVQTRAYRAPEVILMYPHYDQSVDMWSVGVVIAELFRVCCNGGGPRGRNYQCLFESTSCFPLSANRSPLDPDGYPNTQGHILESILAKIGTASEEDSMFLKDQLSLQYLRKFTTNKGTQLYSLFPGIEQEGVDLLHKLLQFNPYFRPTAAECLTDPYFKTVYCHNPK